MAIIGAGPGGLAAARFLKSQGFLPTLIEAHNDLGGQWNAQNPASGVWTAMHTNTARMVTRFSDADYPDETAMFPRNSEVLGYLRAYAERFGLLDGARFSTRLLRLEAAEAGGWTLTLEGRPGASDSREIAWP